jgi:hypothetical protein
MTKKVEAHQYAKMKRIKAQKLKRKDNEELTRLPVKKEIRIGIW